MANLYDGKLKDRARMLRKSMTKQEIILWNRLRSRQMCSIKFLRQKPFGIYILDFYAPQIKLAIELDGSQHYQKANSNHDCQRDNNLALNGIATLRYSNNDINFNLKTVLEDIYNKVQDRIKLECASP